MDDVVRISELIGHIINHQSTFTPLQDAPMQDVEELPNYNWDQMMEESLMSLILLVIAVSLPQILISIGTEMITHQPPLSMAKAILLWMSFDADPHADSEWKTSITHLLRNKTGNGFLAAAVGLSMAAVDRFLRLELVSCISV